MATGMSVFSVGGNLGFALGPFLSVTLISYWGFSGLSAMVIFSLLFVTLLFFHWGTLQTANKLSVEQALPRDEARRGAYVSLFFIIITVIMRTWTHLGIMTYIPFYFIDYLKGDPLYSGTLVSSFLFGGAAGTILGSLLADRWGLKPFLFFSLLLTSLLFPLIFVVQGLWLFVVLTAVGMVLISSFTVTIVMAQQLLPRNLGIASGLMVGFAIGAGGLGVTLLGVIADRFGVEAALKSILLLPVLGMGFSLLIRYPLAPRARDEELWKR
jgi:MFS transporter, FSR family, fosmidomycin resistance protein